MNENFKVKEIYIRFVTLYSLWSGKDVLYFLLVGKVLLFVIRILLCVIIAAVSSIFLNRFEDSLVYC